MRKPEPEIFPHTLGLLGVRRDEAVLVDDLLAQRRGGPRSRAGRRAPHVLRRHGRPAGAAPRCPAARVARVGERHRYGGTTSSSCSSPISARACRPGSRRWPRRSTRPRWGSPASASRTIRSRASRPTPRRSTSSRSSPRCGCCSITALVPRRGRRSRVRALVLAVPGPGTESRSWYLGPNGSLGGAPPVKAGQRTFTWNKRAVPATDFTGNTGAGGLWGATPTYNWAQNPPGTSLSYLTGPLSRNTVVFGAGALQAWIKASTPDVDLQVTVSEVSPDGKETFVQNGWLRASERKLDPRQSTLLEPVPTFAPRRRRCPRAASPRSRCHWITRATPTGRGRGSGSRSRRRTGASRCGASPDQAERPGDGLGGVLCQAALAPGAAGRARSERAHIPASVSGAARRAVPSLQARVSRDLSRRRVR